jgi:two-component system cell cycle response regulator DivK
MFSLQMASTVLVVDDIETNRMLARVYLERLGWSILEASSGRGAIEMLRRIRPSHILLDVKMPDIDGVTVAKFVRGSLGDQDIKIVGYTAHALKEEIDRLATHGFDSVLVKPIVYADISIKFGPANIQHG